METLVAILTANTILSLQRSNIYFHSHICYESSGCPIGAGLAEVPATEGAVEPLEPTIRLSLAPDLAIGHMQSSFISPPYRTSPLVYLCTILSFNSL